MLEGLSWLHKNRQAYCVTFAQGIEETELLRRFGGNLSHARRISFDEWKTIEELQVFGEVIQVGWCEGWAFVYEDNGFRGTLTEVLRPLSAGTRVVSIFRNVNAVTRFCYAEDSTVLAHFDPIDPPFAGAAPQVQAWLRQAGITDERGAENTKDDAFDFIEVMFLLAEAAGVRLDQASLVTRPLLTSFISNPLSDFIDDLLARGGDEQTASRLLALLGDRSSGYANRFLHILRSGQQKERQPHIRDDRPLIQRLRTITNEVLRALLAVQITPVLLTELETGGQETRNAVIEVLLALICYDQIHDEEGARERLLTLAEYTEAEVSRPAALALGSLGDQRAIGPLLRILAEYSSLYEAWHRAGMVYSPVGKAVQLLGQLRAASALEPLLNLLDPRGADIDFQRALYKALTLIGGEQVVDRLLPLLQPQPQDIRECSVQQALLAALTQLQAPELGERLLKLLNPQPTSLWESDFQQHSLKALANLGDQRASEPLVRLLNPQAHHSWEWAFQEQLVKTLRQLGETRAELDVVEQAAHNWRKTLKWKMTITMQENNGIE